MATAQTVLVQCSAPGNPRADVVPIRARATSHYRASRTSPVRRRQYTGVTQSTAKFLRPVQQTQIRESSHAISTNTAPPIAPSINTQRTRSASVIPEIIAAKRHKRHKPTQHLLCFSFVLCGSFWTISFVSGRMPSEVPQEHAPRALCM